MLIAHVHGSNAQKKLYRDLKIERNTRQKKEITYINMLRNQRIKKMFGGHGEQNPTIIS